MVYPLCYHGDLHDATQMINQKLNEQKQLHQSKIGVYPEAATEGVL